MNLKKLLAIVKELEKFSYTFYIHKKVYTEFYVLTIELDSFNDYDAEFFNEVSNKNNLRWKIEIQSDNLVVVIK